MDYECTRMADFVSRVSAVVQRVVPDPTAKLIAKSLYGAAEVVIATGFEIDYTYGTVYKSYREVKYSDGSFAYFQSKYVVVATVVDTAGGKKISLLSPLFTKDHIPCA